METKQIKCYCGHTIYCDCSPLEEPKQETLEEAAEKYFDYNIFCDGITDFEKEISIRSYIAGAKWQAERMYSEEDLRNAFKAGREGDMVFNNESPKYWDFDTYLQSLLTTTT